MTKSTSVNLSEHFCNFIAEQVQTGRYGSASEVVREGLRVLEERQSQLQALNRALEDGLDSGIAEDFEFDAWLERRRLDTTCEKAA
jgi:antitoxin ParD1/3/4